MCQIPVLAIASSPLRDCSPLGLSLVRPLGRVSEIVLLGFHPSFVYCGTSTRSPLDDQLPHLHRHSSSPDNSSPASVSRRGSKPPPWTLYNSRARYLACDDRLCIFHLIAGPTDRYQAIARAFAASTVDTTLVQIRDDLALFTCAILDLLDRSMTVSYLILTASVSVIAP